MKSNMITIMKKEFARFFKDRRMVLTTIFMPGILIFVMYTFLGQGISSLQSTDENFIPKACAVNLPESFAKMGGPSGETDGLPDKTGADGGIADGADGGLSDGAAKGLPVEFISGEEAAEAKALLAEEQAPWDLLAVFPEDFEETVAAYQVSSGKTAPQVELYYNSTNTRSNKAYKIMMSFLENYERAMVNKFDINSGEGPYDLASEEDMAGMMFSMMLPLLLMVFSFSGCMAVAPESIAGEKERGTIATLLVTPMKRSHLALGKIISLSAISVLSGLSSFLGTMLSLPKMMGDVEGVNAGVYQASDYLLLLAVILSTVLVIISLISIISAFAKNVKEATSWVTPLMIVVVVIALTSMIDSLRAGNLFCYLIPLYNSVQCMNGIFSFSPDLWAILITVAANVVCTGICAGILTKLFNSEQVVFGR